MKYRTISWIAIVSLGVVVIGQLVRIFSHV